MASDAGAQRTEYGTKTGEQGRGKLISSKPAEMIKAGGAEGTGGTGGTGPTGSSRSYPKGGKVSMTPDFNPQKKSASSGSDWAVGGC